MTATTRKIIKYVGSGLLILAGLGALFSGSWVSFIFIILGTTIIFPPTEMTYKKYIHKIPNVDEIGSRAIRIIAIIILFGIGSQIDGKKEKKEIPSATKTPVQLDKNETHVEVVPEKLYDKGIPGLAPVDVYLNFEKAGFKTEKELRDNGSFWYNDLSDNGIDYHVETYCERGVDAVDQVRITATRMEPQYNDVEDMKQFLKFACSIPYEGGDKNKTDKFIEKNFYKDRASIVVSGVKFTIYCPTEFLRMIDIEKE